MTIEEFEISFKTLLNRKLKGVKYYEINYGVDEPQWNNNNEFDSLDFGLDLEFDDNSVFGIIWDSDFYQYGLSLKNESISKHLNAPIEYDVSKESTWKLFLNYRIIETIFHWSEIEVESKLIKYPQDIELKFDNSKSVFISAYEIREDGFEMGMIDNITVYFSRSVAQKHNFGNI